MSLKTFKPYTKSSRGTVLVSRSGLWRGKPYKPLISANNSSKGRNNYGRITSRNHGGGHKHKYRQIDFYRKKFDMTAEVERIEYDPNRSCHIMLVKFEDGQRYYYLAPKDIKVGEKIQNGSDAEIKVGNCLPLKDIPVGIYTSPEISCIGRNEKELTNDQIPYEIGQASFKQLARAQITGQTVGMLKVLFHSETLEILGIHCFGQNSAEIVHIGQAIMAQKYPANSIKYFVNTTFNYPTMAEAYRVAALNGINRLKS